MSEPTPTPLDSINAAAEQVRQQLKLTAFDAEGVAHLDNFIRAQRGQLGPAERPGVVMALGCFLGQCLVAVYRGEWGTGKDRTTGFFGFCGHSDPVAFRDVMIKSVK